MICELENLEIDATVCPINCMYKATNGTCGYGKLTEEHVDYKTIAFVKNLDLKKVKCRSQLAVSNIKMAMSIERYSDFVKTSFPRQTTSIQSVKTVARGTSRTLHARTAEQADVVNDSDSHVKKALGQVFGLADNQQKEFWSEERYSSWASRTGTAFSLTDIRKSLAHIKL